MRIARIALAAVVGASLLVPVPAAAAGGGNAYYVTNRTVGGPAEVSFTYGRADDTVLVGDWDGDGDDTLAVRRGNRVYVTNRLGDGAAELTFAYGRDGDEVVVGDWDGDGDDTLAVRRGNVLHVTNVLEGGAAEATFAYGRAGDELLVGDWDGDGDDTFAVRRGRTFFGTDELQGGAAAFWFDYGREGDLPFVGDWNGDAAATLGVRRVSTFHLNDELRGGAATLSFAYGRAADTVLVGDWNGDGRDTPGLRRARLVVETGWSPFATVGGVVLRHPAAQVERVGFHESNHDGARQLEPTATTARPLTLPSRGRGTGSRSAADIVAHPEGEIRSPVTGTVLRAGTYTLYCDHSDDYAVIAPDDRPGWEVKVLHIDGVRVRRGDRVEAGVTVLAPRPTRLPFGSQVDDFTAAPSWPHVHLEVVDPSIPDRPGSGC